MKNAILLKIKNILFLGGFMKILSEIIYYSDEWLGENLVTDTLYGWYYYILFGGMVFFFFKKNWTWREKFNNRFPKISIALQIIGVIPYLALPLFISMLYMGIDCTISQYSDFDNLPRDNFVLYGVVIELLEYVIYAVAIFAVLREFYYEKFPPQKVKGNFLEDLFDTITTFLP